jgi:hypothetical protein
MMHSIVLGTDRQELRSLSEEEVLAVSGAAGTSVPTCDVPAPAPTTGSTAGLYLYPLVYQCMN